MRSYETARKLFSLLELCSWGFVVCSVFVVFVGFDQLSKSSFNFGVIIIFIGVFSAFFGVAGAAGVQVARASVDGAEYGQQALQIARDTLEVSRQALRQNGATDVPSFSAIAETNDVDLPPTSSASFASARGPEVTDALPSKKNAQTIEYKGVTIDADNGAYKFGRLIFYDLDETKAYIDELGVNEDESLETVPQVVSPKETIEYRGVEVIKLDDKFQIEERVFYSLQAAQKYVDRTLA